MGLKVVGAGLGRTGSFSLKTALEALLGGTCYHMMELIGRPEHIPLWHEAMGGHQPDWTTMLKDFTAAVDWPVAAMWQELHEAFPDAAVVLSVRSSSEAWWNSFSETILQVMQRGPAPGMSAWYEMSVEMLKRLTPDYADRDACIAAYEAHNEAVRRIVNPGRLIEWMPSEGWGPICAGLGLPQPADPFPHLNTTEDFRAMAGLESAAPDGS